MRRSILISVLLLIMLPILAACGPSKGAEIKLLASESTGSYLGEDCKSGLLGQFKAESGICVTPVYVNNVDMNAQQEFAITGGNPNKISAFLVDEGVWLHEKLTSPAKIAETNIVFGIDSEKAAQLGWQPGTTHTMREVFDLMNSSELATVVCNAHQCNVGAMFFTGIVTSIKGDTGNPATLSDFSNQGYIDQAKSFYGHVARSGGSSAEASNIYFDDKNTNANLYNAIVLEEPAASALNARLASLGRQVTFFYLSDANVVASHTLGYLAMGDPKDGAEQARLATYNLLVEFLKSEKQQTAIANTGLRPVIYGITPNITVLKPEWGFVAQPNVAYVPIPKRAVMMSAIRVYAEQYKKPADVVMCLDNSGSMQNNGGFEGLKKALDSITSLTWLASKQLYPSSRDSINVFLFGTNVIGPVSMSGNDQANFEKFRFDLEVNMGNHGDTALYDCAKYALDTAIASHNQNPNHNTVVVLMTDGQRTVGWERKQFIDYYKSTGTQIPVISIALGSNASGELGYDHFGKFVNGQYFDGQDLAEAFKQIWGGN